MGYWANTAGESALKAVTEDWDAVPELGSFRPDQQMKSVVIGELVVAVTRLGLTDPNVVEHVLVSLT